ncbi:ParB/RepB/Spo0J family partition protein [Corynebacterium sp. ES2715-CONJ3]|uniref:ParB/RepB/Spo0J family partition protein n=1 Tax=Corynebacterium sp. ES2715-CONJ3 TaxID=2974028 RepID=UPI002169703E|nr:ParB/RepB/Spo0J family partition protein [Corynebacterium sp. ES2715-CONJ3]MCS4492240.1 ParB/RepB/Spo0J family partition protein [Corynebacterium sp. ES2715-CONJ3]
MAQQESRKGGLGRGLAALITSTPDSRLGADATDILLGRSAAPAERDASGAKVNPILAEAAAQDASPVAEEEVDFGAQYREIPIGLVIPNAKNPRQAFDEEDLGELVHSIKEFGLLQPIIVRAHQGRFEIIMGERRWRAASKAGLKKIPAIIRDTDDQNMLRDALLENIHRVQLNPLEEAAAYEQLLVEFSVTQNELADRLGRSRPMITNMLRLLKLPVAVQTKVAAGVLSAGHARALLGLKDKRQEQERLAERIVAEGMSVRATEEAVVLLNRGEQPQPKKTREKAQTPEFFYQAAEHLADNLDTKVSVTVGKRKGKIVVEFGGREDFDRIMALIAGGNERH